MANIKGTLDFKFTIFSLSCTLWVTDKPSNLDKPSRRFACDTLWVRPTNPHSFTARPCAITHTETSPQPAANPHNTHLVQEHGTPGCGISGKAPKSPPSRAPALHAFADRSVALPSPCTASAPCPTGRPLSRPLNLVWPLSIKLVTPPDHPRPPDHSLPPLHGLTDP